MVPISDRTHHSALRPERAGVQEVVALSRHEGEVKPLEQLGHHHFSLHLQTPIVLNSMCYVHAYLCDAFFNDSRHPPEQSSVPSTSVDRGQRGSSSNKAL